jgi:hypothetical protein
VGGGGADSPKGGMFQGTVAIQDTMDSSDCQWETVGLWDRSDVAENSLMLTERLIESIQVYRLWAV